MSEPLVAKLSDSVTLIRGDCLDVLPTLSGVHACVTDPPYGLPFRGQLIQWSNARNQGLAPQGETHE